MNSSSSYIKTNDNFKSKKTFNIELIPTLNRAVVLSAFILGKPVTFGIKYDKKSPALQFQIDSNDANIRTGSLKIQMCRNLEKSIFCKTFLQLESIKNEKSDYQSKFIGINHLYAKQVIQFISEKYDFQINNDKNKPSQNSLTILGWKIQDIDNDLLFYYVQRKFYSDITKMNIIRTAGFQLATKRGLELLDKYNYNFENSLRKVDKSEMYLPSFDDVPDDSIKEIDKKIFN